MAAVLSILAQGSLDAAQRAARTLPSADIARAEASVRVLSPARIDFDAPVDGGRGDREPLIQRSRHRDGTVWIEFD
ncbi:MAG: hypothetical protein WA907_10950 [Erythrobacter sp.]